MDVAFTYKGERSVKEKEVDSLDIEVNENMSIRIRIGGILVMKRINGVFEETHKLDF